jgi:hypothetical protein
MGDERSTSPDDEPTVATLDLSRLDLEQDDEPPST